jgi:hypothetical protein
VYDTSFNQVGEGKTDQDGLIHLNLPYDSTNDSSARYALSEDLQTYAFATSNWDSGVYPEQFGFTSGYYATPASSIAYLYSDRPLYRPGQPVYFKGILRTDNDLEYTLPKEKEVEVVIRSYDQEVYRQTLPISDYGSFNGELKLDTEAALGGYTVSVHFPDKTDMEIGTLSFTVAEYRKPEFQVSLTASPANLLNGQNITAQMSASYYSGGALKNADVAWTLRADPFFFQPPAAFSNYSFYDDSRDQGPEGYREYATA